VQVFEAIRKAKPPRLYVAADGPRANREGEAERVARVREIATAVDWPCEVKTLFREENLGCKYAVSGGITWFFEHEEQGIILEDDCLPSQSFFWFCEELLNKYNNDCRIGQISGFNYGFEIPDDKYDIFFSKYGFIWGWAAWRRSWEKYDIEMKLFKEALSYDLFENYFSFNKSYQVNNFRMVKYNEIDTWDYQWSFARFINKLYTVVPKFNLVTNIGFRGDATHTRGNNPYENIDKLNLKPNKEKCPEYFLEFKEFYKIFEVKDNLLNRVIKKVKNVLR